jgi:hypothetical protein
MHLECPGGHLLDDPATGPTLGYRPATSSRLPGTT